MLPRQLGAWLQPPLVLIAGERVPSGRISVMCLWHTTAEQHKDQFICMLIA